MRERERERGAKGREGGRKKGRQGGRERKRERASVGIHVNDQSYYVLLLWYRQSCY